MAKKQVREGFPMYPQQTMTWYLLSSAWSSDMSITHG